jgi:hypothetical protein
MKKYATVDASDVSSVDFNQVIQTSADTLRYSIDGSLALLKYEGEKPSFLSGNTEYSHEEILAILAGPEWTSDELI